MKRLVLLLAMIVSILAFSFTATAAPKQMPDGNVFDAEFYAQNNPDVVAVLGTDEKQLYQHYLSCGAVEGRLAYEGQEPASIVVAEAEAIKARLAAFKAQYPQGSEWNDASEYNGRYACYGFATLIEEQVFGNELNSGTREGKKLSYKWQVYPGCVYITPPSHIPVEHISVVTEVTSDGFVIAEGNYDGKVNYNRKITWNSMLNGIKRSRSYELEEVNCILEDIAEYDTVIALYESDPTLIPAWPATCRIWSSCPGYLAEPYWK